MNTIKINEQILEEIQNNCSDDKIMGEFLNELIYEEAEHLGQWRWKDTYKKIVEKYCIKWEVYDEN